METNNFGQHTAVQPIRVCERCGRMYDWRRSGSRSLKMTYCNALCEGADLGFTIEGLLDLRARAA